MRARSARGPGFHIDTASPAATQGTVVVFPAHQMHRVTHVSFGQRVSLVGWVLGQVNGHYWEDKEAVMERTIELAEQEEHRGVPSKIPDRLMYYTLQSYNTRLLLQSNWEQLLAMTERQIDLTGKLFDESGLRPGSLHAEQLGIALLRYATAISSIGNSVGVKKSLAQKAWASCERASWLLADTSPFKAHALDQMRAWERIVGPQKRTKRPEKPPRRIVAATVCCDWPGHAKTVH